MLFFVLFHTIFFTLGGMRLRWGYAVTAIVGTQHTTHIIVNNTTTTHTHSHKRIEFYFSRAALFEKRPLGGKGSKNSIKDSMDPFRSEISTALSNAAESWKEFDAAAKTFAEHPDKHPFNVMRRAAVKESVALKTAADIMIAYRNSLDNRACTCIGECTCSTRHKKTSEIADSYCDQIVYSNSTENRAVGHTLCAVLGAAQCLDAVAAGYTDYGGRMSRALSSILGAESALEMRTARADQALLASEIARKCSTEALQAAAEAQDTSWAADASWCAQRACEAAEYAATVARWKKMKADRTLAESASDVRVPARAGPQSTSPMSLIDFRLQKINEDHDRFKKLWSDVSICGQAFLNEPNSKHYNALRRVAVAALSPASAYLNGLDALHSSWIAQEDGAIECTEALTVASAVVTVCEGLSSGYTDFAARARRALLVMQGSTATQEIRLERVERSLKAYEAAQRSLQSSNNAIVLSADSIWAESIIANAAAISEAEHLLQVIYEWKEAATRIVGLPLRRSSGSVGSLKDISTESDQDDFAKLLLKWDAQRNDEDNIFHYGDDDHAV